MILYIKAPWGLPVLHLFTSSDVATRALEFLFQRSTSSLVQSQLTLSSRAFAVAQGCLSLFDLSDHLQHHKYPPEPIQYLPIMKVKHFSIIFMSLSLCGWVLTRTDTKFSCNIVQRPNGVCADAQKPARRYMAIETVENGMQIIYHHLLHRTLKSGSRPVPK